MEGITVRDMGNEIAMLAENPSGLSDVYVIGTPCTVIISGDKIGENTDLMCVGKITDITRDGIVMNSKVRIKTDHIRKIRKHEP